MQPLVPVWIPPFPRLSHELFSSSFLPSSLPGAPRTAQTVANLTPLLCHVTNALRLLKYINPWKHIVLDRLHNLKEGLFRKLLALINYRTPVPRIYPVRRHPSSFLPASPHVSARIL